MHVTVQLMRSGNGRNESCAVNFRVLKGYIRASLMRLSLLVDLNGFQWFSGIPTGSQWIMGSYKQKGWDRNNVTAGESKHTELCTAFAYQIFMFLY